MGKLNGKTAVITGGSSGIGLATAKRFAAEGATVFIMGRRRDRLDAAVAAIGGAAHAVQGDVADLKDLDRLYDAVRSAGRRIDIVFANAGAASKAALRSFARTWASDLRERGIRVNLIGPGPTETGSLANASQAVRDELAAPILRGSLGQPDEIAAAVLFLASADAAFVNATELFADGGYAQV